MCNPISIAGFVSGGWLGVKFEPLLEHYTVFTLQCKWTEAEEAGTTIFKLEYLLFFLQFFLPPERFYFIYENYSEYDCKMSIVAQNSGSGIGLVLEPTSLTKPYKFSDIYCTPKISSEL